jgi:hypothetical protein
VSRLIHDEAEYEQGCKWFATWHRDPAHAYGAKAIDVDLIGYCPECLDTLYLIEATRGRQRKTAAVLEHLGHQLNVPVLVVYQDKAGGHPDQILVDRRFPDPTNFGWLPEVDVWHMLLEVRAEHGCTRRDVA